MKSPLFFAVIASVLLGSGATYAVMDRQRDEVAKTAAVSSSDSMTGMNHSGMGGASMGSVNAELKGKSGDDFDRAFLTLMTEHHQGAIDMAKQAQASAKHDEIKAMAGDIITAQAREIEQMQEWRKQWGY